MNELFADAQKVAGACSSIDDLTLADEVELLKVVSAQDVEDDGEGGVRIAQAVAPERVISVVDPEARHGHRSRKDRYDGYKLHVSVDVTSDLFVAGQATTATAADARVLPRLLEADPMAVAEVTADTHCGDAATRRAMGAQGIELVAPAPPSSARNGFFTKDDFEVLRRGPSPARRARSLLLPARTAGSRPALVPRPAQPALCPRAALTARAAAR